jgi:hypothetical protein
VELQVTEADKNAEQEIRKDTVRRLLSVGGALYQYLHPEAEGCTFSRFKELINESLNTNFSYSDLYDGQFAGWLFNGNLDWSESDRQQIDDLNNLENKDNNTSNE